MVCRGCGKESADGFRFCPHCGMVLVAASPAIESPSSPLEVGPVVNVATVEPAPPHVIATDRTNEIGTYVFGAFSVISLLVSVVKGIVPIYLVESAIWAGAAWYWYSKKSHSELAKAIVLTLATLVVIGEVIQIASQPDFRSEHIPPAIPDYAPTPPTSQYPTSTADSQGTANSEEPHLKSEPKPREETRAGLEATISCDSVVWDRDEYGDGDPKAIANLHRGDIVQYVGHVTVSGRDIIRVHGRKGYVEGCVDVKQ